MKWHPLNHYQIPRALPWRVDIPLPDRKPYSPVTEIVTVDGVTWMYCRGLGGWTPGSHG